MTKLFLFFLVTSMVLFSGSLSAQDRQEHSAVLMRQEATIFDTTNPLSIKDKPAIGVNLISFDPAAGDVAGRLTVLWPSSFLGQFYDIKHDALLFEKNSVIDSFIKIKGGVPFVTFNSSLNTMSEIEGAGSQFLFPFDSHRIKMKIGLKMTRDDSIPTQAMPFDIDCTKCIFEGFAIKREGKFDADGNYDFSFTIQRSIPTKIFAVLLNVVMLMVAVVVLIMAIRIARSKVAPEMSTLGFIGGLLFAMPAVRSLQPRVPHMGLLIDYFGFFWAEGLLVVALFIVMVCWLGRAHGEPDAKV